MKKLLYLCVAAIAVFAIYILITNPDWIVDPTFPKASALDCSDKCPEPPASQRNYFDAAGNEYDYQGNLINPVQPPHPTGCPYGDSIPIDSPKCVAPDSQDTIQPFSLSNENGFDGK